MTGDMIDRDWLHDFAMACRTVTLYGFEKTNNCILSTRVGLDVLTHYGLTAKPQPVRVVAWNEEGYRLYARQVPPSQWPDSAWAVGIEGTGASDKNFGGWDGHLVVLLRNPSRKRTLIDLTADQLDRPAKGIRIGGPLFMDLTPVWTPGDMLFAHYGQSPSMTIVGYEPQVNAGNWRSAPDWSDAEETNTVLVKAVIDVLDEKYPEGPA